MPTVRMVRLKGSPAACSARNFASACANRTSSRSGPHSLQHGGRVGAQPVVAAQHLLVAVLREEAPLAGELAGRAAEEHVVVAGLLQHVAQAARACGRETLDALSPRSLAPRMPSGLSGRPHCVATIAAMVQPVPGSWRYSGEGEVVVRRQATRQAGQHAVGVSSDSA